MRYLDLCQKSSGTLRILSHCKKYFFFIIFMTVFIMQLYCVLVIKLEIQVVCAKKKNLWDEGPVRIHSAPQLQLPEQRERQHKSTERLEPSSLSGAELWD